MGDFYLHILRHSLFRREVDEMLEKALADARERLKTGRRISDWAFASTLSQQSRELHSQLMIAELALKRSHEEFTGDCVTSILLKQLRRTLYRAKQVFLKVCYGLVKLGAPTDGIRANFFTNYLFPQPRNDAIYA